MTCSICGESIEDCCCEKEIEDHSGEELCESCPDRAKCLDRSENDYAMYLMQFGVCHTEEGKQSYLDDEVLVARCTSLDE